MERPARWFIRRRSFLRREEAPLKKNSRRNRNIIVVFIIVNSFLLLFSFRSNAVRKKKHKRKKVEKVRKSHFFSFFFLIFGRFWLASAPARAEEIDRPSISIAFPNRQTHTHTSITNGDNYSVTRHKSIEESLFFGRRTPPPLLSFHAMAKSSSSSRSELFRFFLCV